MNKYFNFEIYTIDPITGTAGWEINMVSVKADTKLLAKNKLYDYPNFDCVILYNFEHEAVESADYLLTDNYEGFKILKRIDND